MGRSGRILAGAITALALSAVFAPATIARPYGNGERCRAFVVRTPYGPQRKLFCRDRYSGWQEQSAPPAYYSQARQSYGGPNYSNNRWRQQQQQSEQPEQNTPDTNAQANYAPNAADSDSPSQSKLAAAIDDLVAADSTSWVMNHFRRGSVYGEQIESTDQSGRPTSVRARFNYQSGNSGWVRVKFAAGNLSCIEFWDFEGTCRPLGASPSHALAAAAVLVGTVAVAAAVTGGGHNDGTNSVDAEMKHEKDQRDFQNMIQANRQIQQNMQNH